MNEEDLELTTDLTFIEAVKIAKQGATIKRKHASYTYKMSNTQVLRRTDAYDSAYLPSYDDITTDDWEVVE